jgi:hypothetical protein
MPSSVYSSKNAELFISEATPFWRQDPVYHNLQWVLALNNIGNADFKGAILTDGNNTWVGVQTDETRALILHGPDHLSIEGVDFFREVFKVAKGLISSRALSVQLIEAWGITVIDPMPMYLYRLDQVDPVLNFQGDLKPWLPKDRLLLAKWLEAFAAAINENVVGVDFLSRAAAMIAANNIRCLEIDGQVVSMVGSTRSKGGVACINYVFTPDELRGRGYAFNCVGSLSKLLLQRHNSCCLYAEEAYLASNRVYQKLGYRVVARTIEVTFA